ncbi:flagellar basal body P-ring protein FlgI [Escherichia coli]
MGNAKSLRGGTLLMTPLKGVDSQVQRRWRRAIFWLAAQELRWR